MLPWLAATSEYKYMKKTEYRNVQMPFILTQIRLITIGVFGQDLKM